MAALSINGLRIEVEGKEVVKGLSLQVPAGEVLAIMGPTGSSKSILVNALMGHPKYAVTG